MNTRLPKIEMQKSRTLFHIEFKSNIGRKPHEMNGYYGSLSALCMANPRINESINTLMKQKFPYENGVCIIRKGILYTTGARKNKSE